MSEKILLLLADGMRPDMMLECGNPYVREFLGDSVYTLDGQTVMPSVTLPCHTSLFLSVPADRHGILTNTWTPQVRPVKGLCEVLKDAGKKCGFFHDWSELRDLVRPGYLTRSVFYSGNDYTYEKTMVMLTDETIKCLREGSLDFIFLYIGLPDILGHGKGFTSEEYKVSLKSVWDNIRLIKEALPDEYSMIVTADHGGNGRSHGSDSSEEMTIPIIFNGEAFKGIDASKVKTATIMDIAPTITAAMGVKADPNWEGVSLL